LDLPVIGYSPHITTQPHQTHRPMNIVKHFNPTTIVVYSVLISLVIRIVTSTIRMKITRKVNSAIQISFWADLVLFITRFLGYALAAAFFVIGVHHMNSWSMEYVISVGALLVLGIGWILVYCEQGAGPKVDWKYERAWDFSCLLAFIQPLCALLLFATSKSYVPTWLWTTTVAIGIIDYRWIRNWEAEGYSRAGIYVADDRPGDDD
jgi:hypothetical protein